MKLKIIILNILLCIPTVGFSMDGEDKIVQMPNDKDLKTLLEQHNFHGHEVHQQIVAQLANRKGSPKELVEKSMEVVEASHFDALNSMMKDAEGTKNQNVAYSSIMSLARVMEMNKSGLYKALFAHDKQLLEELEESLNN